MSETEAGHQESDVIDDEQPEAGAQGDVAAGVEAQGAPTGVDEEEHDELFLNLDEDSSDEVVIDISGDEDEPDEGVQGLEEQVKALEEERDKLRERMLRAVADLENYRKRARREQEEQRKYGVDRMALELIPAVDNLERALEHAQASDEESAIYEGVKMVYRQVISALEKFGVKAFEATGEQFNPEHHEAIQQVESTDHDTGEIVDQFQKGYFLHDRLLRAALVAVAKRVEGDDTSSTTEQEDRGSVEVGDSAEEHDHGSQEDDA